MKLTLYHTDDKPNTINKTIEQITEIEIQLRSGTDLYKLQLLLAKRNEIDYSKINYAKMLDSYYFASYEEMKNGYLVNFDLKKDVLETYKNDILNSDADIIEKSEPSNNANIRTSKEVESFKLSSSVVLPKTQSIILVSVASKGDD